MNARDPNLPLRADEAEGLATFAARTWDEEIVPALTDYIRVPAKSPHFDGDWEAHGHIERVIVAAHGNSLRALVMVLDRLTPETIPSMELDTGVPLVYRLKADSTVESKKVLTA